MQWYATLIDKKNNRMASYLDRFRLPATNFSGMIMFFILIFVVSSPYISSNCLDDGKYKPGIF